MKTKARDSSLIAIIKILEEAQEYHLAAFGKSSKEIGQAIKAIRQNGKKT